MGNRIIDMKNISYMEEKRKEMTRREFLKKASLYLGAIALVGTPAIGISSYNPIDNFSNLRKEEKQEIEAPEPHKKNIDDIITPKTVEDNVCYLRVYTGSRPQVVTKKYEEIGFSVKVDPSEHGGIVRVKTYVPQITEWLKSNEKEFKDAYSQRFVEQKKVYEKEQLEDLVYYLSHRNGIDPRFGHSIARAESNFDQYAIACKLVPKEVKDNNGEVIKIKLVPDNSRITALGVMQLNWKNGFTKSDGTRITWDELIGEPRLNIDAGTKHLKMLQDKYDCEKYKNKASGIGYRLKLALLPGRESRSIKRHLQENPSETLAAAAYNAGEKSAETGNWVMIPETREYVQRVMRFYEEQKRQNPDWQDINIIRETLDS